MRLIFAVLALSLGVGGLAYAQEVQDPALPDILPMRERAALRDAWLAQRLDGIVPKLMRDNNVDMWVLIAREYNEDPVVETMLPATWLSARRRTILVFYDPGDGQPVERLAVSRYPVGDVFEAAWTPEQEPDQWKRLADIIALRDPERIAINTSETFAHADGLTSSQYLAFRDALPAAYRSRLVASDRLGVGWLETRIPAEMLRYPEIVRIAHAIIAEGLSEKVIAPGKTAVEDVMWWYRDRIRQLGLVTWFHPSVSIQRPGVISAPGKTSGPSVIEPGDLLHVDFGITYLGLNTDTQHHAYVLKPGESDAPAGLKAALKTGNRMQDILTAQFKINRTGNEMLARARAKAAEAGIETSIYSHPIGFHGHAAGTAIGMWDNQEDVPGPGDYTLHKDTAWSIELNIAQAVPEWDGQKVRIMLEEDAFFDGDHVKFLDGRQTEFHLIPRRRPQ